MLQATPCTLVMLQAALPHPTPPGINSYISYLCVLLPQKQSQMGMPNWPFLYSGHQGSGSIQGEYSPRKGVGGSWRKVGGSM